LTGQGCLAIYEVRQSEAPQASVVTIQTKNVQSKYFLTKRNFCGIFCLEFINVQTGKFMGTIYKLKPELINFILEKKKTESRLSCRQFVALIWDKFQVKVSKSSINSLIKEAGLSMPVGRRRKKRRQRPDLAVPKPPLLTEAPAETPSPPLLLPAEETPEIPTQAVTPPAAQVPVETPAEEVLLTPKVPEAEPSWEGESTGAILLKVADCLVRGAYYISEAIRSRAGYHAADLLAKTEALLYSLLVQGPALNSLIGQSFTSEEISLYSNKLQEFKALGLYIFRIISSIFQEVWCVKVSLGEGMDYYLDGQLHTVWSTSHIPYDFSSTLHHTKSYLDKYFQEDNPLVLFTAPGYEVPPKEFFDFLLNLNSEEKQRLRLTLYGNKFEEIETIPVEKSQKYLFIFGLWSWQFGQFRKVKSMGEFNSFYFEPLKKEFYLAPITLELLQPNRDRTLTLTGAALKTNPNEKIKLVILSNFSSGETSPESLAKIYLSHWPNLEEAFQDFSHKIELFTYTASSQHFFSIELLHLPAETPEELRKLFILYLKALDLYVKWHFLPAGYEDTDFSTIKERFYNLKTQLKEEKEFILATFIAPSDYAFLRDLEYALRRINEKEIIFTQGKRLWCRLA